MAWCGCSGLWVVPGFLGMGNNVAQVGFEYLSGLPDTALQVMLKLSRYRCRIDVPDIAANFQQQITKGKVCNKVTG